MADQVTISTFLELRDNLSPRLSSVIDSLNGIDRASNKAVYGITRLRPALDSANRSADSMVSNVRRITTSTSAMHTALRTAMGAVTAVFGYRAIKSVVNLDREFENLEFRIAGTIKAFNLAPSFGQAQLQGQRVLGVLRDLAAKLPGEAEEYAGAFTTALPKIIASGMTDLTQAADFVSRYTAVALSNSVDAAQAGRDLMLMLSGRAGLQVKTFTVLSERIGLTAKAFNALSKSARLERIQAALKPFESMLDRVGEGFEAKLGAAQSQVKEILRLASAPLFDGLKTILSEIEKYLRSNKATIVATSQVIARDFLTGFQKAKDFLVELPGRLQEIWDLTKLIAGVWAGATLVNGVANLIRSYKELRAVLVGVNVLSASVGTSTAAGAAGAAGAGGAGAIAGRLAIGATSAAALAGVAALLYPSSAGGDLEASFEAQMKDAANSMLAIEQKYTDVVALLKRYDEDAKKKGEARFSYDLRNLSGVLQAQMFEAKDAEERIVSAYEKLGVGLGVLSGEQRKRVELLRERLLDYAAAKGIVVPAGLAGAPDLGRAEELSLKKAPKEKGLTQINFNNNRFDIKQEFAEGYDPDRIAVAFANDLSRIGDMKIAAAYVQTGGVR